MSITSRQESSDDPLAALVMRSQRGDRGAFAELVTRTQEGVYNLAYSMLGNQEEAEDMTQEAYLRVWRALPEFRGDSKFTTWLFRVVTNVCLNRRRYLRSRLSVLDEWESFEELAARQKDVDAATIEKERKLSLWAAVAALPEKYRMVITLFYQQELSYREVAEALSLPLGTVKAHLNRARHALAERLKVAQEVQNAAL